MEMFNIVEACTPSVDCVKAIVSVDFGEKDTDDEGS